MNKECPFHAAEYIGMLLNKTGLSSLWLEECYLERSQLLDVSNANDSPIYGDNINRVVNAIDH
jgi:hypothetical protein